MSKLIQLSDSSGDIFPVGKFAELLWTNSNPTSSFEAQTISLGLSSYKFVLIYYGTIQGMRLVHEILPVGGQGRCISFYGYVYARMSTVTTTGVVFSAGFKYASYGGTTETTDNTQMIPYKIYGIR